MANPSEVMAMQLARQNAAREAEGGVSSQRGSVLARGASKSMPPDDDKEDRRGSKKAPNLRGSVRNVEAAQAEGRAAQQRMMEHEIKQARYANEETEDQIQILMREGQLTEEEAQARYARMMMHRKQEQEEKKGMVVKGIVAAGADIQTTEQMLEELLDKKSKFFIIRCVRRVTGFDRMERAVIRERERRKKPNFRHMCPAVLNLVHSTSFELFFGLVMLCNGLTIGISASERAKTDDPTFVDLLEHVFTVLFVLEVVLRVMADGWIWIWGLTNLADFILIFGTGVVPLWILGPMGIENEAIRVIQVLRVLRLIRLVRTVRTVKEFRTFWKLIQGILDSGKLLFWMYVLLGAMLYVIGIFSVHWIGKVPALREDEFAQEHFGDVPKAVMTLFQTTTLDSWSSVARPLMKAAPRDAPRILLVFIVVIMIATLVMLNLVTAVIVKNAFTRAQQDDELNARAKREAMSKEIQDLRDIFFEIDEDCSGTLSKDEYDEALRTNDRIIQKFNILQISPDEREEIWHILDTGDGQIQVDAFAEGLRLMQGGARAKDSFTIVKYVHHTNTRLESLGRELEANRIYADEVRRECEIVHRQLGGALMDMMEFVELLGHCVPPGPAARGKKDIETIKEDLWNKMIELEEREEARPRSPMKDMM
eukprot:TRINITY_DN92942_c0_g1_i1.p1 TRINITY_DN92942_c0_g1~~TRINITY_DN92942_c0_g1_i1.p1  ORF type:complete len:652 (+),score=179.80 TRINITY_DN92942_c0_g1_i1:155-2110(+)